VDYNVPLDAEGAITDDRRIRASLDTVKTVLDAPAVAILCSHMGRPKGERVPDLSLRSAAARLSELLERPVRFVEDCIGDAVAAAVAEAKPGDCLLLENLRYHSAEKANEDAFADALAAHADLYVNDAFGAAHRAHASVSGVASRLPSAAGHLLRREVEVLGGLLDQPRRPFVFLAGGAKTSDKVPVLKNLLPLMDTLLVGGGMAYTFLRAQGVGTGSSRVEETAIQAARDLLRDADIEDVKVVLPVDHVCAERLEEGVETSIVNGAVPDGLMGLDIGPASVEEFAGVLRGAGTVLWNGPVGAFETAPFDAGSRALAAVLAEGDAVTVCGGGDTAAAVEVAGVADRMTHVSTGGGASLELLEGKTLPGVAALVSGKEDA
jgi:phosphoglycerate kinase